MGNSFLRTCDLCQLTVSKWQSKLHELYIIYSIEFLMRCSDLVFLYEMCFAHQCTYYRSFVCNSFPAFTTIPIIGTGHLHYSTSHIIHLAGTVPVMIMTVWYMMVWLNIIVDIYNIYSKLYILYLWFRIKLLFKLFGLCVNMKNDGSEKNNYINSSLNNW